MKDLIGKLCFINHPSYNNLKPELVIPVGIIKRHYFDSPYFRLYRVFMMDYIEFEPCWISEYK